MSVSEPRFSANDVALLLESRRREREPRGQHGHLLSAAKDPANQFKWRVEREDDYANRALLAEQERWSKQYPEADSRVKLWRVVLDD